MKAVGLVVSEKKIFGTCILKTYILTPWPTYAMNLKRLENLINNKTGIIPVKFGEVRISGSRDVVWSFP